MASPYPSRSRLARSSLSTPRRALNDSNSSFGLTNSPSTPYDIYQQRNQSPLASASPRSASTFLPPSGSQHVFQAYRRNVGFGSPGVGRSPRFSQGGVGTSTEISSPRHSSAGPIKSLVNRTPKFIRRKSIKQRLIDLPSTIYDWILFSPLLDFADPAIGYPAGLLLHFLSILTLIVHPEGSLHLSLRGKGSQVKAKGLFAEQSGGGLASRRRQAQDDAWRWLATMTIFILLIAALANAYHLFTARRRYQLWMKPTTEKISSENASLIDLPHALHEEQQLSLQDRFLSVASQIGSALVKALIWGLDQALHQVRNLPYVGIIFRFLFPPTLSRRLRSSPSGSESDRMHAIDMWTAPDVQLRIFCIYSPLHAVFYILHLKSSQGISHFLTAFTLMVFASAQMTVLVHFFTNLVRDKNVVAGEVLHEYDEKFVKPRAMTVSRDASTMTDEAEMKAAKRQSWINRRHSSDEEGTSSSGIPKATPSRRARATTGRKSQMNR